jgi:hypothetical protein
MLNAVQQSGIWLRSLGQSLRQGWLKLFREQNRSDARLLGPDGIPSRVIATKHGFRSRSVEKRQGAFYWRRLRLAIARVDAEHRRINQREQAMTCEFGAPLLSRADPMACWRRWRSVAAVAQNRQRLWIGHCGCRNAVRAAAA